MRRLGVLLCAVALVVACGGSSGGGGGGGGSSAPKETSAKTVAANPSDFPGLSACPESGSWDDYLKAERTKDPSQYTTDKADWDKLKTAGADDSYIAVYADSSANCGRFGSDQPSGKVANVYTIRFKDAASAQTSYSSMSKDFNITDQELQQVQSAGGKIVRGSATGLGDNSLVVEFAIAGLSFYIAFWQKSKFVVAMITYNLAAADAEAASKKINDRIT
jgi:hypothetical protein